MSSERIDFRGYFLRREEDDWVMVLTGPWLADYYQVISTRDIKALRLSYSVGWSDQDISFVRKLKSICRLEIYNWEITDISALEELTQLEHIGLECNYKHSIDFSRFTKLRACFLKWRPKSESIFDAVCLETLNIVNYPFENLSPMHKLHRLKELKLTSKKLNTLSGAAHLSELRVLDLFQCSNLTTLEGIQGAADLREVELDTCKRVGNLEPLGELRNVRRIAASNCGTIKSLLPLKNCIKLEELFLTEDTDIEDGSVNVFRELPNLKVMLFANRKHYSHRQEQVQEAIRLAKR